VNRSVKGPLAVVLALGVVLLAAAPADAKRRAPFGFFGTSLDGLISVSDLDRSNQGQLMVRSGVESIRVNFAWDAAQPTSGPPRFGGTDATVRFAAQHGLSVLPLVMYTPRWASSNPSAPNYMLYAPTDPNTYGAFLTALIRRYGPTGTFWAENPGLPRIPIRDWQIWNEPAFRYFWATPDYPRSYPRLLKVAYRAVHAADRHARVVMAGLASFNTTGASWTDLKRFYRHGVRRYYDVLAIHPFSWNLNRVIRTIQLNRKVQRRYHDSRKPIYLTELSWPASKGRIPPSLYLGFEVTPRRQRRLLAAAYARLIRDRRLHVRRAFWYTWASTYSPVSCEGTAVSFQYSGLLRRTCGPGTSFSSTRLLSTYARTARRYEGCRKGSSARSCRR
jgi:hypothetical protein